MSPRPLPACVRALLLAATLAGCVSVETAAPPVATLVPPGTGASRAQLEAGRSVYLTKCARCHAPEPIRKYSRTRWNEIIPEMMEDARLSPAETAAVAAYVRAVLAGPGGPG